MNVGPVEGDTVEVVRRCFGLLAAGDVDGAIACWSPDARYHAFDADGIESRVLDTFDRAVRSGRQLLEGHTSEIVDIRAVGDELVFVHLVVHATTAAGKRLDAEYPIIVNVQGGRIQWACDFIDGRIQAFLDEAWESRRHPNG